MKFPLRRTTLGLALFISGALWVSGQENWAPIEAKALERPTRLIKSTPFVSWPALGWQDTLRIGDRMAILDEMPIRYITLVGAEVNLQVPFPALEFWSPNPDPTGRYGYELTFKFDNRAIVGVSVLNRGQFLPSLKDEHWNTYLASLGSFDSAYLVTNADSAKNPNQIRILNGRTRVLEFRYRGKEETDPERATLQMFTEFAEGPFVVFTLECNSADLSFVGPAFENFVTSFEPADE